MGTVITITSGKGGVGKSTTTANIATALALRGKKVVAVDFDIGLRNLDMILGLENRIVYDVVDVMEGKCNLSQAIIKDKRTQNLHFLPASQTKDKTVLDKQKVEKLINDLKEKFDYILIDSPAGIESGFEHSIYLADRALVVTTPEISAVRDADRVIGIIDAKSKKAQEGEEVQKHIIINRLKPELVEKGEMLSVEDVLHILALPLIGVVPDDEDIVKSTNLGEPIVLNEKSLVGEAFRRIARRIEGEDVEFLDLKSKKGFLDKLKGLFK
ncbi:septum site-determining protein MinD [Caminibacter pacificus]|uniref:Septum site-determining protein MinD n=1 Tax=Caminibacter pacificus TaxID=1424653 RepID=A0AAJ4RCJ2_9BACT|nr:septum site-determining protein MinD [Caminibacter pacificus]QCI27952.1 septum site-determining protein MinD [Caminibacter pacificus]ROR39869.1 septum site-determining protein MinD [Caminibacter pacificus]